MVQEPPTSAPMHPMSNPSCHRLRVASDAMNPNRDRTVETRRRALKEQVEGLERWIAEGRDEVHVTQRLADTRTELQHLDARSASV